MKTSIRSLLLAAAFLALQGCADDSATGPAASKPVEMPTPSGWTRTENYPIATGISADYMLKGPAVTNFHPNIFVVTGTTSGISVDSAASREARNAQAQGIVLDSNKAISIGGTRGWLLQYRTSTTGGIMVQRYLMVVHAGKDCEIIFSRIEADQSSEALFLAQQAAITLN